MDDGTETGGVTAKGTNIAFSPTKKIKRKGKLWSDIITHVFKGHDTKMNYMCLKHF